MTGSGTLLDPYIIGDVNDLQAMKDDLSAYYELGNDIDASATIGWNLGLGFEPVGPNDITPFSGQLDGKGYTISDLYINRPAAAYTGLFGYVIKAILKNINLLRPNITGSNNMINCVGSLAGLAAASITGCSAINISLSAAVSAGSGPKMGGICGYYRPGLENDEFKDNHTSGTITGNGETNRIAGLVGEFYCPKGTVSNCYSSCTLNPKGGAVDDDSEMVGGLFGYLIGNMWLGVGGETIFSSCYSEGDINGGNSYVGGLVAFVEVAGGESVIFRNCYATGSITASTTGAAPSQIGGFVGVDTILAGGIQTIYEYCYATGNVTGNGASMVGGFGGDCAGAFDYCYATGDVTADDGTQVGGFAGLIGSDAIATHCYATGEVIDSIPFGNWGYGGFAGNLQGSCSECFNTGNVTGSDYIGGFVGYIDGGSIDNCYSRGDMTTLYDTPAAGGFCGYNDGGVIEKSYSTGLITADLATDLTLVGGFCGENDGGTITDCFWDTETSGYITSDGGTGKLTAEMKTNTTFTDVGWDFALIWGRFSFCNDGYPCLRDVTPNCSPRGGCGTLLPGVLELLA